MKKLAAFLFLGACGPSAVVKAPPAPTPAAPAPDANFSVTTYEVIEKSEDDGTAYLKIFIDGAAAGQTDSGPRSQVKRWEGAVPAGNRPVRFEYWIMKSTSEWSPLGEDHAPRERFMRVEEGVRTKVEVKFFDQARGNSVTLAKEPMGRPR